MSRDRPITRDAQAGFTLVEMLVALALFALVGLASFAVLDTVIRTRERTEGRLEAVARIDRALIVFRRDVAQADIEGLRLEDDWLALPIVGGRMVEWGVEAETLRRRARLRDGTVGVVQDLVEPVAEPGWRFLDAGGAWHEGWPPEAQVAPLAAVELRFAVAPGGPLGREVLILRRLAETVRPAR